MTLNLLFHPLPPSIRPRGICCWEQGGDTAKGQLQTQKRNFFTGVFYISGGGWQHSGARSHHSLLQAQDESGLGELGGSFSTTKMPLEAHTEAPPPSADVFTASGSHWLEELHPW